MKIQLLSCALAVILVSTWAAASDIEKVRNEKVVVIEQTLAPGERRALPAEHASELVYLDGGSVEFSPAQGKSQMLNVERGEAVFQSRQAGTMKNAGSSALRIVRVEYLGQGNSETWGSSGLSPNYKLLSENQYGRVYDIKIKAGTSEPLHTHHDRIVICLSGAQLRHEMPDGRTEVSTLKTGEIVWRRGGTHVGHNIGTTDLWVIAIEPK